MKVLLKPGGVITMEFPHLLRLIDANQWDTIYHEHFSYFSFTTVRRGVRRPRPAAVRRRGAADPRRLAAHLRLPRRRRGQADDRAGRASCSRARTPPATRSSRPTSPSAQRVIADKREILATLIELKRAGQADRRLRRAGQGQHAAQLLRRRARLPRLHGRPQPAQAGPPAAGHAHPDPLARRDPRGPARTSCSSCPGTSRTRSSSSSRSSATGAGVRRPHARADAAAVKLVPTPLAGAYVVELEPLRDERGWFARTFDAEEFAAAGLDTRIAQCNTSFNARAGTLRGLHYQAEPHAEAKLVRCTRGAVFDVIVDLRPGSATYCRWFGLELRADGTDVALRAQRVRARLPDAGRRRPRCTTRCRITTCPRRRAACAGTTRPSGSSGRRAPSTISDRDATYPDFVR